MIKDLNSVPAVPPPATSSGHGMPATLRCMDRSTAAAYERDVENWLLIQNAAFRARSRPWTRATFRRELEQRPWFRADHLWLAWPAKAPVAVGTIALELPEEACAGRIHWLAVDSPWRRQGLGRMLVDVLEQACRRRGVRRVVLETLGTWTSAMGFYRSLGYRADAGDPAEA